jgi:transcriptional regulator with XRE-family HTH domain
MGVLDAVEELPVLEVTGPALTGWRDDNDKSLEGLAADLGIDAYVLRSYEAHGGPSNMVRNLARAVTFSPNRLRRVAPYMIARLTRLRQRHGLTQRDLADRLGLPQAFVMALESGGVTPSDSLLDRLEVLLPLPDDMVAELASIRLTSLYLGDPEMDKWPEAEQRTAEEPDTEDPDQTDAADEKPLDVLVSVAPPAALYDGPVRIAAPVGSGEEFKARRESKGLTQRELSQFVALSSTALSIFESGRKFLPPQEETMLLSVMDALADVPVADCTGLRLAQRREAARLTAEELAFRAGVESDLIPLLEARGAESAPRHVVRRLARALSPDADALAAATGPALTKRLRTHGWTLERLAELWRVPPALVEAFEAGDMSPSTALVQELEQAMVRAAKLEPDTTEVSPGARSSGEGSSTGLEVIIPNAPPPKRKGIKLLDFCGDQLRQRRETAGFTLESLAAQTGLAYGRLYGYEVQGLIPPPDVARKLAKVLSSETP